VCHDSDLSDSDAEESLWCADEQYVYDVMRIKYNDVYDMMYMYIYTYIYIYVHAYICTYMYIHIVYIYILWVPVICMIQC